MAALAANATTPPRRDPSVATVERIYKATGADEYYVGAVVCAASGKAILTNLDAAGTLGFGMRRTTAAAADDPIYVYIKGLWWVAAVLLADADLLKTVHPLAGSDNPADVVVTAALNPGALGVLVHVDATAVSGWVDLDLRAVQTNS